MKHNIHDHHTDGVFGRTLTAVAPALALVSACSGEGASPPVLVQPGDVHVVASHPTISPAFDLGAVAQRARVAFRPNGHGYSGRTETCSVQVDADGQTKVTPYHVETDGTSVRAVMQRTGTPLVLGNASVQRGSTRTAWEPSAMRVVQDGALEQGNRNVVQHLRNTPQGVEQSWTFTEAPSGSGDLTVSIPVSGQHYVGRSPHGLHFVDTQTGVGLRYGWATWIDANGVRSPAPLAFADGRITITVHSAIVERSAFPAVLDPEITPEFGTDRPAGTTPLAQSGPAIACRSNGQCLAVWRDTRTMNTTGSDIYAARLDATGHVEGDALIITSLADDQLWPSVDFDGTNYVVFWTEENKGIFARRVGPDGTLVDGQPTAPIIADPKPNSDAARVAFGGSHHLVVWTNGLDVYGCQVSTSLQPVGTPFVIANTSNPEVMVSVSFNGTNFMVAWSELVGGTDYNVMGRLVLTAPVGAAISLSQGAQSQIVPKVACSQTGPCLAVWNDLRSGTATDVYGTLVAGDGTVQVRDVQVATGTSSQDPSVVFDGTRFLVTWSVIGDSEDVYARFVAADGTLPAPAFTVCNATGDQYAPALAFNGTNSIALWTDARQGLTNTDVWGTPISKEGVVAVQGGILISTSLNVQLSPGVTFDGENFLVVWKDYRRTLVASTASATPNSFDIFAVRVTPTGTVLDPYGIKVREGGSELVNQASYPQTTPKVAYGNGVYLVVWHETPSLTSTNYNIHGQRIMKDGTVVGGRLDICTANLHQLSPAVASDGVDFLVAWEDREADNAGNISAAIVDGTNGTNKKPRFDITKASLLQDSAAIAYNTKDGHYLVVWRDGRDGISLQDIWGARVLKDGALQDANGIIISRNSSNQQAPTVAFDGRYFDIAWADASNAHKITGCQFNPTAGTVVSGQTGGVVLSRCSGSCPAQGLPTMTFDGSHVFVAWRVMNLSTTRYDIYGNWFNATDLNAVNANDQIISNAALYDGPPAASSDGTGRTMIAYHRSDETASDALLGVGGARIRLRFASQGPVLGSACMSGTECASGHCVDGVCCNSACGNGVTNDCQACSVATGGTRDGFCEPLQSGEVCKPRDTSNACDLEDVCNGTDVTCPERGQSNGYQCASPDSGNVCSLGGTCDEQLMCVQHYADSSVTCRARDTDNPCDKGGVCNETNGSCEDDTSLVGTSCGAADPTNVCDLGSVCSADLVCVKNWATSATTCRQPDPNNECDKGSHCSEADGTCVPDFADTSVVCGGELACAHAAMCPGNSAVCPARVNKDNGTPCTTLEGQGTCRDGECQIVSVSSSGAPALSSSAGMSSSHALSSSLAGSSSSVTVSSSSTMVPSSSSSVTVSSSHALSSSSSAKPSSSSLSRSSSHARSSSVGVSYSVATSTGSLGGSSSAAPVEDSSSGDVTSPGDDDDDDGGQCGCSEADPTGVPGDVMAVLLLSFVVVRRRKGRDARFPGTK